MKTIRRFNLGVLAISMVVSGMLACGEAENDDTTARILVVDQTPDPTDRVEVAEVSVEHASWLVIREDLNGSFGAQIGLAPVAAGLQTGVQVTLDRGVRDGERLWAMIQHDDGQVGVYEFPGPDEPVLVDGLDPLAASFVVSVPGQVLPQLQVDSQVLSSPSEVVVTQVTALERGFIVIQPGSSDANEPSIGAQLIEPGAYESLTVNLSRDAVDGETFTASLWVDTDGDSTFDSNNDTLVLDPLNGQALSVEFQVSLGPAEDVTPTLSVVDSQVCDPADQVTVAAAAIDGPGFVAIYSADPADREASVLLGIAGLSAGSVNDLVVTLNAPLNATSTLYVALHRDIGAVGTFEPLIDPIVSVDDSLLVMSFEAVVEGGSEGDALAPEDTLSPSDVGPEPDSGPPTDGQAPEDGGPVEDIGPVEDTEEQQLDDVDDSGDSQDDDDDGSTSTDAGPVETADVQDDVDVTESEDVTEGSEDSADDAGPSDVVEGIDDASDAIDNTDSGDTSEAIDDTSDAADNAEQGDASEGTDDASDGTGDDALGDTSEGTDDASEASDDTEQDGSAAEAEDTESETDSAPTPDADESDAGSSS